MISMFSMTSNVGRAGESITGSSRRLNENTTSSALNSLPLWNVTPSRSWKVQDERSSLGSHDVASSGFMERSG